MFTNTKLQLSTATLKPIIKEIMLMQPDQEVAIPISRGESNDNEPQIHVKAVTINNRRYALVVTEDDDVAWCVDMGERENYPDELRAEKRLALILSGLLHYGL